MIGGISGVGSFSMGYVGSFYQSRLADRAQNARNASQAQRQGPVYNTVARKVPSLETPVQPVTAARPVSKNDISLPELTSRLENDPAAMAGRMRMRYGEVNPEGSAKTGATVQNAEKNVLQGQLSKAETALGRNDLEGAENVLTKGLPGQKTEPTLPGQAEKAAEQNAAVLPGQEKSEPVGNKVSGAETAQKATEEGECQTCENRKYQDGSDDPGVSYQTPTNIKPEQAASAVRGHEMEHVYREQAKAEREDREVVRQTVTMHTEICPECGKPYVSGGTTETVTRAKSDNDVQPDEAVSGLGQDSGKAVAQSVPGTKKDAQIPGVKQDDGQNQNAIQRVLNAQQPGAVQRTFGQERQDAEQKNAVQQTQKPHVPFLAIA